MRSAGSRRAEADPRRRGWTRPRCRSPRCRSPLRGWCGVGRGARRGAHRRRRRNDPPRGTGRSLPSARWLRSWPRESRPGPSQHPRSNVSAQGKHDTARPDGGSHTSGAASTGSTAPGGSLTAAAGSGGLSSDTGTSTDGGSVRATRRGTRDPRWARRPSPALRSRPWRPVTLQAGAAGPRVPRRPSEAPIPPLLSRPSSGARRVLSGRRSRQLRANSGAPCRPPPRPPVS